ncbi:MAG: hypothetical protein QM703_13510 [Gemmatales bacterium]
MAVPKLTIALNWGTFETAVLTVLREALGRLTTISQLRQAEEQINLELYWLLLQSHYDLMRAATPGIMNFVVTFDSVNQPQPDDVARSQRLKKRPDFTCSLMNPQATDFRTSQINYYVECKRLGQRVGNWFLNDNYSAHGIDRFVNNGWQYAKGYDSAAMVGYIESSAPSTILIEVNAGAAARKLPLLTRVGAAWITKGVNPLSQPILARSFPPTPFRLDHLWVDLCHCSFTAPANAPPVTSAPPHVASKPSKKAGSKTRRKRTAKKKELP